MKTYWTRTHWSIPWLIETLTLPREKAPLTLQTRAVHSKFLFTRDPLTSHICTFDGKLVIQIFGTEAIRTSVVKCHYFHARYISFIQ